MIILRKVRGLKGLTAVFRRQSGSFSIGVSRSGFASALALLFIGLLALLIVALLAWGTGGHGLHLAAADHFPTLMVAGSLASQLKETTEKLIEKQKQLHDIFEKAGDTVDFANADVLKLAGAKDSKEAVEKVRALNSEMDDLGKKRDEYADMKKINDDNEKRRGTPVNDLPLPGDNRDRKEIVRKSLGEIVVTSRAFKEWKANKSPQMSEEIGFGLPELKATFLTTAGWAPETTRIGLVVAKATRPIQVLDIIPNGTTGQAAVKFMEETTLTHASAERVENAVYAESSFGLTERSETVRSIGASVPVTDEQLDDVEGVQSYLEQRLTFGNMQRLDGQILIGDGIAPNLLGLKNKVGIQVQAKGADTNADAIYKAGVAVRLTGRAIPNAVIIHPTNWQAIRLLKTADGIYIWASPVESGPERLWGWQVVQSDADAAGLSYVGDYANFCMLFERKGMEVAVGYVNADFLNGRRTIRAGLRVAFAVFRAAAFCQVTGLT